MGLWARSVYHFGPLIRLTWEDQNAGSDHHPHRLWMQRADVEFVAAHLLPAKPPEGVELSGSCWLWTGALASDGRPMMLVEGQVKGVRRVLYDLAFGPPPLTTRTYLVPACGVPRCCNPHHMRGEERGPIAETYPAGAPGAAGFDRCKYGHPLTPANAYVYRGRKLCRTCRARAEQRRRARAVRPRR